jgi:hypothetical protein
MHIGTPPAKRNASRIAPSQPGWMLSTPGFEWINAGSIVPFLDAALGGLLQKLRYKAAEAGAVGR